MKKYLKLLILALTAIVFSFGLIAAGCSGNVTLSFDAGDGTPVQSITAKAGSSVELPLSLRKGYVLSGWSEQAEGGALLSGTITVPEHDTNYYAVWTVGYEVTFDADGGVYAEGAPDPLTLAAGTNLHDAVKNISPTKSGLIFGAWFFGDDEITNGYKMPAENISLTAKYKVEYTMETYLCNLAGNSYVRGAEVFYASDYVGKVVTPDAPEVDGFAKTDSPAGESPVPSVLLGADASRNILKFYYDRRSYRVIFHAGTSSATGEVSSLEAIYESTVTVPQNGFAYEGYRFAGWSDYMGGEVEYLPNTTLAVTGDLVLYAVWDRGYTDRYGGDDLVFFPRLEPSKAILLRGVQEFEGERDGDSFTFTTHSGTLLDGKIYGTTFSYRRSDIAGTYTYMEFSDDGNFEPRYQTQRTLTVDEYLNVTYQNGSHTCSGVAVYSEETGDYVFTGPDETFRFLPIKSDRYEYGATFLVGTSEVGTYVDFVMVDSDTGMGYAGYSMMLILDGYSTAMLGDMENYLTYEGRYYVEGAYMVGSAEVFKIVCYIADPDGTLTGQEDAIVTNFFYTVPLEGGEYNGYVQADAYRGEYTDGNGNTLVLDGFGLFADSVIYTENGTQYTGRYRLTSDLLSGSVVSAETEQGKSFSFRVDTEEHSFTQPEQRLDGTYTEFRYMDGNSLKPPFLILYDEDVKEGDRVLGQRAEVYIPSEDGNELEKAAWGYCTVKQIGNSRFSLYTFVRTGVTKGYETKVGEKLVFYNSVVTSTVDYMSYNVYCLLEETYGENTASYWDKYEVTGGGEIWVCNTVTAGGLGALYISANGTVTEGQFSLGTLTNFEGTVGTFLNATETGDLIYRYFDLSKDDDGNNLASPRAGLDSMLYVIRPTGADASSIGTQMIFLDGVSRMKYTSDGGANFIEGSYEVLDRTCFGDPVYAFRVGNEERFRFAVYTLPEYGDEVPLAVKYDEELEEYIGEPLDGLVFTGMGRFTIDGFHRASLDSGDGEALSGEYFRDELMQTVTFTLGNGTQYKIELDLSEKTFVRLDWATGRQWQLLNENYEPIHGYYAVFEDDITEKTVRIKNAAGGDVAVGHYVPLGTVSSTGYEEYLLRGVSMGEGYPTDVYRVTFVTGGGSDGNQSACLVNNAGANGVFSDDDWNVLVLDGYGLGEFFTDSFRGSGTYTVIDFGRNFIDFEVDDPASSADGQHFYFLMGENTFYMTDYEEISGAFFSAEMKSIVFGSDGTAYLGAESGPYFVQDGKAYVYLDDKLTVTDAPSGDEYSYNGTTYYRWNGEALTLNGTVLLRGKDGQSGASSELTATLTFTPNRTTNRNLAAVFTFAGYNGEDGKPKQYDGYSVSLYPSSGSLMGESTGEFSPTVTYGNHSYPISFSYAGGKYSFTVEAGYNSLVYLDHNARYEPEIETPRGGRLMKTSFGFGAIELEKTTLSGDFFYLFKAGDETYGKPLHFEGVAEDSVKKVGYVPGYGDRLELEFQADDGKHYLLNYYEYYQGGLYYWCYGFYTYQDVETADYSVRVKTLLYTKMSIAPGYLDAQNGSEKALGKITSVTLTDKKTGEPIVAYDTGITPGGYNNGVWLVDKASVTENGSRDTCAWGKGYLVTFTFAEDGKTVTAAEVKTYEFVQVVNYMQHLVNLFIDEEGNIVLASMLIYNADFGRYDFPSDPHGLEETEDGTFSFLATWNGQESRYTVKAERADDVTVEDGEGNSVKKPGYTVTVTRG